MAGWSSKRIDAIGRFIQTSDDLSERLSGLPEDIPLHGMFATASTRTSSIPKIMSTYQERVEQVLATASPELSAFVTRLGIRSPSFLTMISADPVADVPHELDERLGALKTRLTGINTHLEKVADDANNDFENLGKAASSDFNIALERLKPLADFIQGDWKYSRGEADKAETLCTEIDNAFETASTSGNATADKMRYYEGAFAQIRDADLLGVGHGLRNDVNIFKMDIDSWITRTNQQLESLRKNLADKREIMQNRQRDLENATTRYKKAVSDAKIAKAGEIAAWMLMWPVGLVLHYTISQNFIDDVSNAQRMVDQAKTQQEQIQKDMSTTEVHARELQNVESRFQQLKLDYTVLESSVTKAAAAAEIHKRASKVTADQTISTWVNIKSAGSSASATGWALTKLQYANMILETLDKARFENSVKTNALDILNNLKSHDDSQKSVGGISAPLLPGQPFLQVLLDQYSQM